MADHPHNPDDPHIDEGEHAESPLHGDVPVEEDLDAAEPEAPRRAASAQFIVDAEVGSEAAMREAMDPANQSLADALRLSFRVLQMVMVVLVVLFFASGFQTVDEGKTGVLTRWGRIVEVDGQMALTPGLKFSAMPYPISEFHIFESENRTIHLRDRYFPRVGDKGIDEHAEQTSVHDHLDPRYIGYVITNGGDIAHARISARYRIDENGVVDYVESVRDAETDRFVTYVLLRAMVHVSAELTLQEFIDLSEEISQRVQIKAQQMLNDLRSGIVLSYVEVGETTPALAIRRIFGELPQAQVEAENAVEQARQRALETLVNAAGERYRELTRLITRYEEALQLGEEERAAQLLADLNERFDSGEYAGDIARTLGHARAYRSKIEQTLGTEYRRFASLLPAFREHPELVVKQRWLESYGRVLGREDAEIWYVPRDIGNVRLDLASLHELKELRQKLNLDRRERRAMEDFIGDWSGTHIPWLRDFHINEPGRQLLIEDGRVRPRGRQNR